MTLTFESPNKAESFINSCVIFLWLNYALRRPESQICFALSFFNSNTVNGVTLYFKISRLLIITDWTTSNTFFFNPSATHIVSPKPARYPPNHTSSRTAEDFLSLLKTLSRCWLLRHTVIFQLHVPTQGRPHGTGPTPPKPEEYLEWKEAILRLTKIFVSSV